MAYLPSQEQYDEHRKAQQGRPGTGFELSKEPTGLAASAPAFSMPKATGPVTGNTAQGGGSGFINFDQYRNANKDSSARTATGLVQGVADKGAKALKSQQTAVAGFNQGLASGTPSGVYTPGNMPTISTTGTDTATLRATEQLAGAPPVGTISRDEATKQGNVTYTGPEGLAADQAQQDTTEAADALRAIQGPGGVAAALKKEYGGTQGGYSAGQSALDAALSGGDVAQGIKGVQDVYGGLEGRLASASADATARAAAAKGDTSAYSEGFKNLGLAYDAGQATAPSGPASPAGMEGKKPSLEEYQSSGKDYGDLSKTPEHMGKAAGVGGTLGPWGAAGSGFSAGLQDLLYAGASKAGVDNKTLDDINKVQRYFDPTQWADIAAEKPKVDFGTMGDTSSAQNAVYTSMTSAELDAVAQMSPADQGAWLRRRAAELGLKPEYQTSGGAGGVDAGDGSANAESGQGSNDWVG